jgi:aminoglycoside phosphotransferase (APT) family kinase protein
MSRPPPSDERAVRPGEQLDVARVDEWLRGHIADLEGSAQVTQYSGGASNWTYRLKYPSHDLVLRRPPAGTKAKSAHDMAREYEVQRALRADYPLVPELVALCTDPSIIGCDFYVMRRIDGIIARKDFPEGVRLEAASARTLCERLVDELAKLHAIDPTRSPALTALSKGPGYVRRQVEGWSARYEKARTWNVPSFRYVRDWLAERVPDDVDARLVHNDWRLDNVVLDRSDPSKIVGVLDWEMATVGDPLMDLGGALAYWVEANDSPLLRAIRRQPSHLPGMLRRAEIVERYLDKTGYQPENWPFYEVFGVFRLAGIAQQIYYRYHHGQTSNPAFRRFWLIVTYLDWRCRSILRSAKR